MTKSANAAGPLRVCLIAKANPYIWVHYYVKAFRSRCDVITAGSCVTPDDVAQMNRTHLASLVEPNDIDCDIHRLEDLYSRLPAGWKPDLIVTIQSGLPPIEDLALATCPTAYISIDTWHDFAELVHAHPYDFVFCAQREFVDRFVATGSSRAYWLPLACDPDAHRPVDSRSDFDIAFVGSTERSLHAQRLGRLERLSERFSVNADTALGADEMARAYCRARIGFNSSVAQDVNMRVFEVLAMGIPLLTNRDADVNGLLDLFEDGTHLVTYDDNDLVERAAFLVKDEAARKRISAAAHEHVLAQHTYQHRIDTLLALVSDHVDWSSIRERATTRTREVLLGHLPTVPGIVADLGIGSGTTKYPLRRLGAVQFIGIARADKDAHGRRGSYDDIIGWQDAAQRANSFDTVLLAGDWHAIGADEGIRIAWNLLRSGGTLVIGVTAKDWPSFAHGDSPEAVWANVGTYGFVVLRMDMTGATYPDEYCAFVVARKRIRSLQDVARDVYSRNPMPNITLEEILRRLA